MHRLWASLAIIMTTVLSGAHVVDALIIDLPASKDTEVSAGTHFAGERQSNQGAHPEIEPIRANDGFGTLRHVYLQFDLLASPPLAEALANGQQITAYSFHAYNLRNFALGDAVVSDVIINLHYVANDAWAEGAFTDWAVIASPDPENGLTWDNQVGVNEFLTTETEDATAMWYAWPFAPEAFTPSGAEDDPALLSLALVPSGLDKTSAWYLVSSFASREFADASKVPFLRVETAPVVPEPATITLFSLGLLGCAGCLPRRRSPA